ncbi:MAG: tol-pal system-associated acyl-CoA thioesterase [Micavibrio aeruginosavorus]|uniref:Tol-pal system-associated acyl-CoA thioesterase n=1 Tax=Micavibrio aeruginosavorus TaxID=349221 RepID=A0A7T5R0T2_9BACT|nr:MAG: tol-pal system-associated acyl-CoA thioesterase [Micavibrio aeruginosavorus]
MTAAHKIDIRIYYEDTDAGGIVFYANYLKFAERGRTEYLRHCGFENKSLMDSHGIIFVVRRVEADYLTPAYLDDMLRLETSVTEAKNASFTMKQSLFRHNQLVFCANVILVCVDCSGKPVRLPDGLRTAMMESK